MLTKTDLHVPLALVHERDDFVPVGQGGDRHDVFVVQANAPATSTGKSQPQADKEIIEKRGKIADNIARGKRTESREQRQERRENRVRKHIKQGREHSEESREKTAETRRGSRRKGLGALHCGSRFTYNGQQGQRADKITCDNSRDEQRGGKHRELYILLVYLLLRCYCTAVHVLLVYGREGQKTENR